MLADKLRKAVLQAAIQGKLTKQLPTDGNAADLVAEIKKEKERLIKEKKIKKQKPLPKITAEEIPFEIPDNWCWVRLGSVIDLTMGQSPENQYVGNNGLEFHQGKVYFTEKIIGKSEKYCSNPKKISLSNEILMSVRAPVGDVNINDRTICIGRGLCSIKILCNIMLYFFYLLLFYKPVFEKKATGTTFKAINKDIIEYMLIPLPPLAEQQRIVEKIEEVLKHIEILKVNEEKLSLLQKNFPDKLKKSLLQAAIQGKLTEQLSTDDNVDDLLAEIRKEKEKLIKEKKIKKQKPLPPITEEEIPFEIPENWRWVRLGEIGITKTGNTPSREKLEYKGNDIAFITPKDILNDKVNYNNQGLSLLGKNFARTCKEGSILQVCIGGSIGKIAMVDREVTFNQQINSITSIICLNKYIFFVMQAQYFIISMKNRAGGTATPIINKGLWDTLLVPLPPIAEEKRIVKQLNQLLDNIESL